MSLFINGKKYNLTTAKWRGFWSVIIHGFPGTVVDCGIQRTIGEDGIAVFRFIDVGTYTFVAEYKGETKIETVTLTEGTYFIDVSMFILADYVVLEYIEATGTQYIDTGIIPRTFDYEVGFIGSIVPSATNESICWGFKGSGNYPRWLYGSNMGAYLLNANTTEQFGTADDLEHTAIAKVYKKDGINYWSSTFDGIIQQNDRPLTSESTWSNNTLPIYVGARNNSFTAGDFGLKHLKNWWCKKADIKIMDLIPIKRKSDNKAGMLDMLTGQFFTSQGIDEFIAGPEL